VPSEVIKLVRSWCAAGCPDDFSADINEMTKDDTGKPGEMERMFPEPSGRWGLTPFNPEKAEAFLPGIYFVEHGQTFSETRRLADNQFNLGDAYHEAETSVGAVPYFYLGAGYAYNLGLGVPQDHNEAARWFRKGAEQGLPAAQCSLGLAYCNGEGVPQDLVQAHMWLSLAVSLALKDDQKEWLSYRHHIAERMTPQQIAEAQRLAELESGRRIRSATLCAPT